jgi:hypothetical protein
MASGFFTNGKLELWKGNMPWDDAGTTFKSMLMRPTYTFDPESVDVADISAQECTGTGYARKTITSRSLTIDATNHVVQVKAANVDEGAVTLDQDISGMVIFKDPGTGDANCILLMWIDVNDVTTNGGSIIFDWDAAGICNH